MEIERRSGPQHRRFFGLVAAIYAHLPEAHVFRPDNADHLRAWLTVRAGRHTVQTFFLSEDATELARVIPIITATMLRRYSWARSRGNELYVCVPDSIAYDKMDHAAFTKLCDDVAEIIKLETGLDADEVLKQTEQAA